MTRALTIVAMVELVVIAGLLFLLSDRDGKTVSQDPDAARIEARGPLIGADSTPRSEPVETRVREVATRGGDDIGHVLHGLVSDRDGNRVRANLTFVDEALDVYERVTSDDRGYGIVGIAPGTWRVLHEGEEFTRYEQAIRIPEQTRVQRFDVVLDRKPEVQVRILTPEGQPLHEALAAAKLYLREYDVIGVATRTQPGSTIPIDDWVSGETYGVGTWRANHGMRARRGGSYPKDVHGALLLDEPPPVFASAVIGTRVFATEPVLGGQREVTLRVSADAVKQALATLRMTLVDGATGQPIANQPVLTARGLGARTDAEGVLVLKNQPPGPGSLRLPVSGFAVIERHIELLPGQDKDLGRITLEPGNSITGTVRDPDGNGVAARLEFSISGFRVRTRLDVFIAQQDGSFEWGPFPVGRVHLRVRAPGFAAMAVDANVSRGKNVIPDIRLQRGTPVRFLAAFDGRRELHVRDDRGRLLVSTGISRMWKVERQLVPGIYTVRVLDGDTVRHEQRLTVTTEPVRVRVQG